MKRLEMKNFNTIIIEKQQKYSHFYQAKLSDMYTLQFKYVYRTKITVKVPSTIPLSTKEYLKLMAEISFLNRAITTFFNNNKDELAS